MLPFLYGVRDLSQPVWSIYGTPIDTELSVIFDSDRSLGPHLQAMALPCPFVLYNNSKVSPFPSIHTAKTSPRLILCLDYCNILLSGPVFWQWGAWRQNCPPADDTMRWETDAPWQKKWGRETLSTSTPKRDNKGMEYRERWLLRLQREFIPPFLSDISE